MKTFAMGARSPQWAALPSGVSSQPAGFISLAKIYGCGFASTFLSAFLNWALDPAPRSLYKTLSCAGLPSGLMGRRLRCWRGPVTVGVVSVSDGLVDVRTPTEHSAFFEFATSMPPSQITTGS